MKRKNQIKVLNKNFILFFTRLFRGGKIRSGKYKIKPVLFESKFFLHVEFVSGIKNIIQKKSVLAFKNRIKSLYDKN